MSHELLVQISDTLMSAQTVEELTRPLLAMLELVTGLESTYLTRVDEDAGVQTVIYARNTRQMQIPEGIKVPWGDTLCKRALDEGRPFTEDVSACWGDSEAAQALGICTYLSTPLRLEDGSLFGLAQREGRKVLLAFIDLDGFKQINDTYGHETGDAFLIEVGKRLSAGMRSSDLFGRLGGDEFVLAGLAPALDADDGAPVAGMRKRISALIEGDYDLPACRFYYPGASLGIISADPQHLTTDQALQKADAAMYLEKRERKEKREPALIP